MPMELNNTPKIEVFDIKNFESKYYNKNLVIEASAGTGKTTNIKLIVRKLVEKDIKPHEILIVTYTEKAAGELKNRIRTELKGIVDNNDLDNLNIYTIHSFCQNAIKEFGLEASKPLNLDVVDEKAMVGDFFDRYVRSNGELKADIDKVFKLKIGIDKDGELSFSICGNGNNLKEVFTDVLIRYYLKEDETPDDKIIDFKKEDPLLKYYFEDKPLDEILKEDKFRCYYDLINNGSDYKAKMLLDIVVNAINSRSTGAQDKSVDYSSFNYWDILDEESEALEYFIRLHEDKGEKDFLYDSFDSLLKQDSDFCKYYSILLNSQDNRCKYYACFLYDNSKYMKNNKVLRIKFCKKVSFGINNSWPEASLVDAIKYFNDFLDRFKEEKLEKYFVKKYINEFYLAWQKEKEQNKWQTFNDMLRTIREVLLTEENKIEKPLTCALQAKYKYAIIDEFQDTNRIQFDTFRLIFMKDDDHHIIVVGDPKQSIYSFQGADLNVYNIAKDYIVNNNGVLARLDTNYRSSEKMINACNNMFKNDFFKLSEDSKDFIEFNDSKSPSGNKVDLVYDGILDKAIWIGMKDTSKIKEEKEDNTDKESKKSKKEQEALDLRKISGDDYAKLIVNTIVDCCKDDKLLLVDKEGNKRPARFNDFAILARSRSEMEPIVRELKKSGIPYIKYKDQGLFNSRECVNFVAIFEAINTIDFTGYNRKKFYKALFTDFFKNSLEEINTEYFNHDEGFEFDCFKRWKGYAKKSKWEDLIDDIIFGSHLYENLKSLDKLQSLSIYKQLGDYAISYLSNNHSLYDLINRLKNTVSDDEDEDSGIIEIGTDFNCVKIMTIHASKGLQYPIVISVAGFKGKKSSGVYTFHDEGDGNNRRITFDSTDEKKDALEEWLRLIYVCFTRAENLLILPYYLEGSFYNSVLSPKMKNFIDNYENDYKPLYFDGNVSASINEDVKEILEKTSQKLNNVGTVDIEKLVGKVYGLRMIKHSYSSISHPKDKDKDDFGDELDEEDKNRNNQSDINLKEFDLSAKQVRVDLVPKECIPYDDIPKGNKIGSAMHEVFERIDFRNIVINDNLKSIIDKRLKFNNVLSNEVIIDYIANMVEEVLNAKLPVIHGSNDTNKTNDTFMLKEISKKDKKNEMEFNFPFEKKELKNYCTGFIDLLFSRGEYYSILDWKSDALNDDFTSYCDEEQLKKHTDEHYSIQRVLYSYCLVKWLNDKYPKEKTLEETFKNHFGGVYYVYLRGCIKDTGNGIYAQTWKSFSDLEKAYNKIYKTITDRSIKKNE